MELEVARGVHVGTSSSDRSLEDPELVSLVKRAFPTIGTNEVISTNNFSRHFEKCYKGEQFIPNRLTSEFHCTVLFLTEPSTLPGGLINAQRRYTHTHTRHIVLVTF